MLHPRGRTVRKVVLVIFFSLLMWHIIVSGRKFFSGRVMTAVKRDYNVSDIFPTVSVCDMSTPDLAHWRQVSFEEHYRLAKERKSPLVRAFITHTE